MLLRGAMVGGVRHGRATRSAVGKARVWRAKPGPATQVPMLESLSAGAPVNSCGAGYNGSEKRTSRASPANVAPTSGEPPAGAARLLWWAGTRDNVPVTMAREDPGRRAGSHGGASLAPYHPG